jgi:hypothetical protein
MKISRLAERDCGKPRKWFHRRRPGHDPMLVLNMSIFNSGNSWERILDPIRRRENVWA